MSNNLKKQNCCSPSRPLSAGEIAAPVLIKPSDTMDRAGAVKIPGGTAFVGTNHVGVRDDGEGPLRKVKVKPFHIGATTVTNAQFENFIAATGYVTEAELFGWSFVFWSQVTQEAGATEGVAGIEWWRRVYGANWRDINGPGTRDVVWFADHPVVHVSWNDACAYATWVGGRLPTEAEWEHAARGGAGDIAFPWGDREPDDDTHTPCNIWQGKFPDTNTGRDGHLTTAPVKSFEPNAYGLYNLVGNVWEWTADPFRIKSLKKSVQQHLLQMKGYKLSKGGSYLCHRSYCYRYRIAARSGSSADSSTTHHGFRIVWVD